MAPEALAPQPVVVLSGGSDIVTIAVVEELLAFEVPVILVGLGRPSIVRDAPNVIRHAVIDWPPVVAAQTAEVLAGVIRSIQPDPGELVAIPTEDGGFRFLAEYGHEVEGLGPLRGAQALSYRGLDKVELFEFLSMAGAPAVPRCLTLRSEDDLAEALQSLGPQVVVKPGLKPLHMADAGLASKVKVVDSKVLGPSTSAISMIFPAVAQEMLHADHRGEAVWWGVRMPDGTVRGMTAMELIKYPPVGGTAAWVETSKVEELPAMAEEILHLLDFVGVVEMPFLHDHKNSWRLLEINARPWLQYALASASGLPLVTMSIGRVPLADPNAIETLSWVGPERLLLALLTSKGRIRQRSALLRRAWRSSPYFAPYSSHLRSVRRRWLVRMLHRAVKRRGRG